MNSFYNEQVTAGYQILETSKVETGSNLFTYFFLLDKFYIRPLLLSMTMVILLKIVQSILNL